MKGALLLYAWDIIDARITRDIDILASTPNSLDHLIDLVKKIYNINCFEQDGIVLAAHTINGELLQTQREYRGIRLQFQGSLGKAKIPMQLDFGFGDIVTPAPQEIVYPVLIDLPAPRLRGYPPENDATASLGCDNKKGRKKREADAALLFFVAWQSSLYDCP